MDLLNKLAIWCRSTAKKVGNGFRPRLMTSLSEPQQSELFQETMPFDPNLLERVKSLWIFGELNEIAKIGDAELVGHPQRGLISAYVAAAAGQLQDDQSESLRWIQKARDWGCPHQKLMEICLANVHFSLTEIKLRLGDSEGAATQMDYALSLTSLGVPSAQVLALRIASNSTLSETGLSTVSKATWDSDARDVRRHKANKVNSHGEIDPDELGHILGTSIIE